MQKSTIGPLLCLALAVLLPSTASATTSYALTIQPYQVCLDDGSQCANVETHEAAGDKVWGQAGIDLVFLPFIQINSTDLWAIETHLDMPGPFWDLNIIQMFFVSVIDDTPGYVGLGWLGANGVAIADKIPDEVFRLDTIAHELGHNLGLWHYDEEHGAPDDCEAGEEFFLMSVCGVGRYPHLIEDILPDGDMYGKLSAGEISTAVATGLSRGWLTDVSIPEPSTVVFSLTGLALIALRLRRQRR